MVIPGVVPDLADDDESTPADLVMTVSSIILFRSQLVLEGIRGWRGRGANHITDEKP